MTRDETLMQGTKIVLGMIIGILVVALLMQIRENTQICQQKQCICYEKVGKIQ